MTVPLWEWTELCSALGLNVTEGPDISGVCIDSRTVQPGDLFIALDGDPGPRFQSSGSSGRDGHDFIGAAISGGAAAVMLHRDVPGSVPTLLVPDTLDGLWALASAARHRGNAATVAVTGSAGKTTARGWLELVLSHYDKCHASTGSLNNHWGVPLSMVRMPADTRLAVFEVGTNHPGEIGPLSRLVEPDVALLLNVLPAHIGNFKDMDALLAEKLDIGTGLAPEGTLVLPADLAPAASRERVLTFGLGVPADVTGTTTPDSGGTRLAVTLPGESHDFVLPFTGRHHAHTALAVIACVYSLGLSVAEALPWLERVTAPKGRGNRTHIGGRTVIDDSYNANPRSMQFAIEALASESGQRVAILGEMLELGDDAPEYHAGLEDFARELDGVITVGHGFDGWGKSLGPTHWGHVASAADLDLCALRGRLGPEAVVLVKGANRVFWVNDFVRSLSEALQQTDE